MKTIALIETNRSGRKNADYFEIPTIGTIAVLPFASISRCFIVIAPGAAKLQTLRFKPRTHG
jgi:hypothetical protein